MTDEAGGPAIAQDVGEPAAPPTAGPATRHYSNSALLSTLLDALAAAGKPVTMIDADALTPVDELRTGGRAATIALAELLAPQPGDRVLDLRCGLGGMARYLAGHHGCQVTGVDVSREHIEVAEELTARSGLADSVRFRHAGGHPLPIPNESFDAAVMAHLSMTVADKAPVLTDAFRILRPGGRLAVCEFMLHSASDELTYPLPWASSERNSFLEQPAEYHRLLTSAGFDVDEQRDLAELAATELDRLRAGLDDELAMVGARVAMGENFRVKLDNLAAGIAQGLVGPVVLVASR